MSLRTTEDDLVHHFDRYGEIEKIELAMDSRGAPRGFGFVYFKRSQDAEFARETLEGSTLNGRKIHIEFSNPRLRKRSTRLKEEIDTPPTPPEEKVQEPIHSDTDPHENHCHHHHYHRRRRYERKEEGE